MKTKIFLLSFIGILFFSKGFSQAGKDGSISVIGNSVVNEYTYATANISAASTSITVANSNLNTNGRFISSLTAGDMIMIIQMQGAEINGSNEPWSGTGWYGLPLDASWGQILAYNNCGNYEFCEVSNVPNSTTIQIRCGLINNYTASGKVQVVRVPRFSDLTISGTLTADPWNGTIGGIVAIENQNDIILNGTIDVNGLGFRGGFGQNTPSTNNLDQYAIQNSDAGGIKGEGIHGYDGDYDANGGRYGRGAGANGGGGGNSHNCGGGGGGNAGDINNWNDGVGVPNSTYNSAWALESPSISGIIASGGGRGGYGHSDSNQDALSTGPSNASWGGHDRYNAGGLGGRPLDYSTGKIFFGGGGGAGQRNDSYNTGGDGGNGGGLVYILNYGNITGTGIISANGNNGTDTKAINAPSGWNEIKGNDGAGGAGAGGTVLIKSNGSIGAITINADGGKGGDQIISVAFPATVSEAEGPGAGGGGGYIATTSSSAIKTTIGGTNGTTNSSHLTEFTPNGATSGGNGLPNEVLTTFNLVAVNDTICAGTTGNPTVTINGTAPGPIIWYDAPVNGNFLGAGTSYTTSTNISTDTTFYVGTCPGNYLIPVSVIIGTSFSYSDANVVVTDENCGQGDGSISGITVSGGALPLTFEWNAVVQASQNLSNLSANNYTLVISDNNGCSATIGTYTVNNISSMTMDESLVSISDENCGQANGSITGITISGGTAPYSYSWNGNTTLGADTTGMEAGSYALIVSDAVGCSVTSSSFTINNIAGPTIDIGGINVTNESCSYDNGSITGITVSGGTTPLSYSWNGSINTGTDTTGLNAGSYTLTVTDNIGCSNQTGPYNIIDNAGPLLDTTSYSIIDETCGNTNGAISGVVVNGGNAPLSYDWNGTSSGSPDISSLSAGTYILTVTDNLGCSTSTSPYVLNNVGLVVDTSSYSISSETCSQANGSITGITVSGGNPGYTYSWNGNTALTPDTTELNAGIYTLLITDAAGCSFTAGPYEIINSLGPQIDTTGISIIQETCTAGNGSITNITVIGGNGTITYNWNNNSLTSSDLTGLSAGNYTLITVDAAGCTDSIGPIVIADASGPVIESSNLITTNENCSDGTGSISGITVSGGTPNYIYTWNGNITNGADTSGLNAGNYTLTVMDNVGCTTNLSNIIIQNQGIPTADFTLSTVALATGDILQLTDNSSSDVTSYWWDFGNGDSSSDQNPSETYTAGGNYTICLEVTSTGTCTDSICKSISITEKIETAIGVPQAFSPNGDNHNDILYVRGQGIASFNFILYNRYGEKVFETTDLSIGWNGEFRGKPENNGVFSYYLEYEFTNGEKDKMKGKVSLLK